MAKAEPRSITRRSLFAALGLPVISALPAPLLPVAAAPLSAKPAPPADIIPALIKAHKRAYAEFIAVLDDLAVAEQAAWHAPRGKRRAANAALRQARAAERHFGDLESDAMEQLLATVPQTLAGAAAMLAYVRAWLMDGHSIDDEAETITLLASVECAVCRAAGLLRVAPGVD
jgi:hypothetical protein